MPRIISLLKSKVLLSFLFPFICWYVVNASLYISCEEQLLQATWSKDHEAANEVIRQGANINAADDRHRTALIWAVSLEDVYLVRTYLSHGAKVNLRDSQGRTALTWADYSHNKEVTAALKKAGATY